MSLESVARTLSAVSADAALGDPLLIRIAFGADVHDGVAISLTLNLLDSFTVTGTVASDMTMAEACDESLEQFFATGLPADAPEAAKRDFENMRPSLGYRGIKFWRKLLQDAYQEVALRTANGRDVWLWSDVKATTTG